MLLDQEYFDDTSGLEIGDKVRVINSAYVPEIRNCVGVIIGSHPCYFPAEGRNLTFYEIRITQVSPDHKGRKDQGNIDYEISSPWDGLERIES